MGSLKVTLCAGAAVVLATLTPTAYAADGGAVTVTPASPAPGADVALKISGCAGTTGSAASAAFVADAKLVGASGTLAGETRVRTSLEPGSYDVKITCGSVTVKGAIKVVADASQSRSATPSAPASPIAPVHAGGGGAAAHLAAVDARSAAPGTAHAVVGLLLAGVAVAAVALRSARRSRRTG
ncbi:hypothetical protein [Streptomyces sp. NPDC101455]|uniref:hypothetical protein n=1 Tax=Streptomyces sp. NPDC101455 TaxID=3366142 RepID=UPI003824C2F8